MRDAQRTQRHYRGHAPQTLTAYGSCLKSILLATFSISLKVVIVIVVFSGATPAQSNSIKTEEVDNEAALELKQRSRYMLEDLRREAVSLTEDINRVYALAEVADAYWNLDKERGATLFAAAMDVSLTLKGKRANGAIRHVLSLASKRDVALAKRLSDQLTNDGQKTTRSISESVVTAIELLNSDAKTAAELAEAVAPAGLTDDAVGVFILELATKDLSAAERVYRTYLSRSAADPTIDINQLLWLGGYPFGYGESYSFANNDLSRLIGFGGRHIPDLLPNQHLANTFLNLAFRSVQKTITEAASSTAPGKEGLNGICYFATLYLIPEVERYDPAKAGSWWVLRQQAFAGISPSYRDTMEKQIEFVLRNRAAARKASSATSSVESDLSEAEKAPAGCERDRAYARASLNNHAKGKNVLALKVAEKIDDALLRESVLQFIYYDLSIALAEEGDWAQAQRNAMLVSSLEQRGLLYIKMAHFALKQNDAIRAAEMLTEADRFAEKISEPNTKATVLLGCAAAFAAFDSVRSLEVLRRAIKAVNTAKDQKVESFSVLRRVDFKCSRAAGDTWYGSSETVERFSLLETVASVAKVDVEGTLEMARSIEDRTIRIRSIASIIRSLTSSQSMKTELKPSGSP